MKEMKKIFALLIVMLMVFSIGAMSVAAEEPATPATGSITITPPDGVNADATNTYKIYKVFDAVGNGTNISYKVKAGKTGVPDVKAIYDAAGKTYDAATVDHFIVDAGGNVRYGKETIVDGKTVITDSTNTDLPAEAIAAIAAYVTGDDPITTATANGTADAVAANLPNGYYYITTTTGTVVTIDSTNPNAVVNDKNTVPSVDKKITGATSVDENGKKALAQVGTTVNYSAVITIGKGAKDYVFHDTMETGLTYNNDAAVTGVTAGTDTYTVGKEGTDTFTITFSNEYIKTLNEGDTLTVTYSATVNDDAVTTDPLHNTAYVSYGDKNSNNKTPITEADVYEAKFTVTKKDGDGKPLANAGFVLKNAAGKYYKIENKVVSWVASIDDATEYKSNAQGTVQSFTGLANGTYTLVEKTVPKGYNTAADQNFTIAEHIYTAENLEQSAVVVNEAGTELPSTGGIGTTIFYTIGTILVLGAGIVIVSKRRMNA